ncbi:hypothetical protein ACF9IK_20165 [Kitasatospora hibisci]|uniref:hypothetical protein n=1 Tax=Kitasatospora hibisci TaxID=3369522 RepID=UPI0037546495
MRTAKPAASLAIGDVIGTTARPVVLAVQFERRDDKRVVLLRFDSTPGWHPYAPGQVFYVWERAHF